MSLKLWNSSPRNCTTNLVSIFVKDLFKKKIRYSLYFVYKNCCVAIATFYLVCNLHKLFVKWSVTSQLTHYYSRARWILNKGNKIWQIYKSHWDFEILEIFYYLSLLMIEMFSLSRLMSKLTMINKCVYYAFYENCP